MEKRFIIALAAVAVFAICPNLFAQTIVGSGHDFSDGVVTGGFATATEIAGGDWNDATVGGGRSNLLCGPCHTPHRAAPDNAITTFGTANNLIPLWSHASTAVAGWTPYSSPTGTSDAENLGLLGQPAGISLACLSCHDGTVALGQFVNGSMNAITMPVDRQVGGGLTLEFDHPISFDYTQVAAPVDPEVYVETTLVPALGVGATIQTDMLFDDGLGTNILVECASCHDPHNTPGFDPLMRMDNTNSQLCLACHDK